MTTIDEPMTTTTLGDEQKEGGSRARRRSAPADTVQRCGVMPDVVDMLMASADAEGLHLVGPDGVLAQLTKAVMERAVDEELSDHLGYERGDPKGRGSGNSRNGTTPKTVHTELGPVDLELARDRNGSFEPKLIPKGSRRLAGFDDQIIALYAGGMTVRDIKRHLAKMYGAEVSPELISRVTDGVVGELNEWQNRALDAVYPILYIDALVIKVRHNGTVINKACYQAIGVDVEGRKQILGLWLGDGDEGAKFWLLVLTWAAVRPGASRFNFTARSNIAAGVVGSAARPVGTKASKPPERHFRIQRSRVLRETRTRSPRGPVWSRAARERTSRPLSALVNDESAASLMSE